MTTESNEAPRRRQARTTLLSCEKPEGGSSSSIALAALVDRIRALDEYFAELRQIETLMLELDMAEAKQRLVDEIGAVDSSKFDALYQDAGISEWNTSETREYTRGCRATSPDR